MKPLHSIVISKRTLSPIVWNLIIQATFLNVFIFVTKANFLHPVTWFYEWYVSFLWQGSWLYIFPLTLVVIGQASASTEDYIKTQPFYPTRLSILQRALSFRNAFIAFLHLMIGMLIPWTYASLLGKDYERLYHYCILSNNYCLSEKRIFLIMGGMWVSTSYFIHSHFWGTRYLEFPVVQLPKFILIKSKFVETLQESLKWVILPDIAFVLFYFVQGGRVSIAISDLFGLSIEDVRVDTITGLLDVGLIMYLVFFSSLIVISMKLMELFYCVYLTERYFFPFHSIHNDDNPTLIDGLNMKEFPILQHLAFLDLMLLCCHNKSRREEIFKLSSFGGHPHLWNAVKGSCTDMIRTFIEDLEDNLKVPTQPIVSSQITKGPVKRNVSNYFVGHDNSKILTGMNETQTSSSETLFSSIKDRLNKSPVIVFLFGDRKDMRIRHTLRLSSPVKWACDSLSFLACHSVKEDQFGVLVNDLPFIIMLLLQLKQTLDSLLKRASLAAILSHQDLKNITEVTALKKSVKRSIYRIVNTFKHYINDLQLSKELENQLMPYICYRE